MAVPFAGLDASVTLYPLRIALHLGLGGACPQPLGGALAFPGSAEAVTLLLLVCVFASTSACAGAALSGQKSGCKPGAVPGRHCSWVPPRSGQSRGRQGEGLPCPVLPQAAGLTEVMPPFRSR